MKLLGTLACFFIVFSSCISHKKILRDLNSEDDQIALLDGEPTDEFPHVGKLVSVTGSFCTGTLIAPNIVLTAAHCLQNPDTINIEGKHCPRANGTDSIKECSNSPGTGSRDIAYVCGTETEDYFTGNLQQSLSFQIEGHSYTAVYAYSFGKSLDATDVGVVVLATPVPLRLVRPARILAQRPAPGTATAVIGFGCSDVEQYDDCGQVRYRDDRASPYFGEKQVFYRKYGDLAYQSCPGDSGGPWFRLSDGAVYSVTSTMKTHLSKSERANSEEDTTGVGLVNQFYTEIMSRVNADKNFCTIPTFDNGKKNFMLGSCSDQAACDDGGYYSLPNFCPNHDSNIVCCVKDESKQF